MECAACGKELAGLEEIMFFCKEEKDVHMTVRPEDLPLVIDRSLDYQGEGKNVKISCKNCNTSLGKSLPFGPNGQSFPAFGTEKVIVLKTKLTKKNKWRQEKNLDKFSSVSQRGLADYYGDTNGSESKLGEVKLKPPDLGPVKYPEKLEDFDWTNLLENSRVARDYQVECFVEALQNQDVVAILPTGAGKTMIASMLLKKMKELNPDMMGLFIVDRIPLVFQQAKAVKIDTDLRVASLCGQNKTMKLVHSLYNDTFDVLVATAGAVVSMLENEQLFLKMFSCVVFDEAHHALGQHKYSHLLKRILNMPQEFKPKILGLTASPFRVKTHEKGQNKLATLIDTFQTTTIMRPKAKKLDQQASEFRTVTSSESQLKFQSDILEAYKEIANAIIQELDSEDMKLKIPDNGNSVSSIEIGVMRGQINAIEEIAPKNKDGFLLTKNLGKLQVFLSCLEIADSIGIPSAMRLLEENEVDFDEKESYKSVSNVAPRLQILNKLLSETKETSKVLVFTNTRVAARRLVQEICERFPEFKAQQVVGHGGWDGQQWVGYQDEIIEDFHVGKCRLLVCTSVLEEGIDVSSCDLVIRYTGLNTLIQFIQSRGRARKEGSRFVVLVTKDEEEKSKDIQEEEKTMDFILDRHANSSNLPSNETTDIIKRLTKDQNAEDLELRLNRQRFAYLPDHSIVEVFIEGNKKVKESVVKEEIQEAFERAGLKVTKIDLYNDKARDYSRCRQLFDRKDQVCLCHVSNIAGADAISRLHSLCLGWNFRLTDEKLSLVSRTTCKGSSNPRLEWKMGTFGAGHFLDRQTFIQKYDFRQDNISLVLSQTGHLMKIDVGNYRIECSFLKTSVLEFGLVSWDKTDCHLFIPLESIPVMLLKIGDGVKREVEHEFLKILERYPVLILNINLEDDTDWLHLREIFSSPSIIPIPIFDTKINIRIEDVDGPMALFPAESSMENFVEMPFDTKKKLLHAEWKVLTKYSDLAMGISSEEVCKLLQKLRSYFLDGKQLDGLRLALACSFASRTHASYWIPFEHLLNQQLKLLKSVSEDFLSRFDATIPGNHTSLLRLVVTPSRFIYQPEVPMFSSRLTRMLQNSRNLVVVSFRDENMQKRLNDVYERVEGFLNNGISVNGRHLYFLCASASQIRDHKAFFVEALCLSEVYSLRKLVIADPEEFDTPAKYLSRLGLFCTADKPTIKISHSEVELIDDKEAKDGNMVTDGSGFIKKSVAEEAFKKIQEPLPSAFQFRYDGMKGVLTIVEDSFFQTLNKSAAKILYRPSQKKFDSDHNELGIVKAAKAHPLTLNRESITLLEALYKSAKEKETWHLPNALINLQEKFLETKADMFINSIEARETLMQYLSLEEVKDVGEYFDLRNEPYWYRLLRHCHVFGVTDLCKKTNIPIKDGCLLMGIPDFTDTLSTGEVFLQIEKDDEAPKIIEGQVFMYRNPCLHPGDIRIVTAVNCTKLHSMKNVLVLPTNADNSLSMMCSGGDLDGDQFSVIWDKDLVPPPRLQHRPLDYGKLPGNPPNSLEDAWSQPNLSRFYVDCMKNELLGRVAHMHLALSDLLEAGAADPMAMKLAESQAVAVDYPKTGVAPQVPKEALEKVKDSGYPDFMQKKTSESYPSNKILGKLFQAAKSHLFGFDICEEEYRKIPLDQSLLVPGHEEFKDDANQLYTEYIVDMKYLMHQFSLKSEEEVILGKAIKLHSLLDADRNKAMLSLQENFLALKKKYSNKIKEIGKRKIECLVSACYKRAYDQNAKFGSRPFLSFPWLLGQFLCVIKRKNCNSPPKMLENVIHVELGESCESIARTSFPTLKKLIEEKEKVVDQVRSAIAEKFSGGDIFQVSPYGSTSVFLCEADSDVDISILALPSALKTNLIKDEEAFKKLDQTDQDRHFLETCISPAVDEILDEKVSLIKNEVPVIKGVIDSTPIDISFNSIGRMKTKVLLKIFKATPEMLLVFWIIVRWARYSALIKWMEKDNGAFLTAEIYALARHLLKPNESPDWTDDQSSNDKMSIKFANIVGKIKSYDIVGKSLHQFFKLGQSLPKEDLRIEWPIPGAPQVNISAANVYVFAKSCSQALHCLLATHNVSKVLNNALDCTETQSKFVKKLPLSLSHSIGSAPEFHARRLCLISGAVVEITEEPGEDRLVLTAEGSRASIAELRIELNDLATTKRALVIGAPNKMASRYFLHGSTVMLMQNSENNNCRIGFADSTGTYQLIHKAQQRSTPVLKYDKTMATEDWLKKKAIPSLTESMQRQLESFPLSSDYHRNNVELTTRFGTFYVVDIDASLPKTQKTLSLEEFQTTCEKGRHMRKNLEDRGDFKKVKRSRPKFKMITLRQGRGQVDIADNKKSKLIRNKRQKCGISMSYNTGMANPDLEKTNSREQVEISTKMYEQVLENLGYKEGIGHRNRNNRIYEKEHWKVAINASTGYEVILNLDGELKFLSMTERNLSWVHATIFHGKEMVPTKNLLVPENDIRFHVQTSEEIKRNSNLFKFVFPDGETKSPIQLEGIRKVPVYSPHTDQELRMAIPLAKHAQTVKLFYRDGVNASIMTGTSHMGENLKQSREYCDLSIYFHNEDLIEALENPSMMEQFVEKILRMSHEMSEELKKLVNDSIYTK